MENLAVHDEENTALLPPRPKKTNATAASWRLFAALAVFFGFVVGGSYLAMHLDDGRAKAPSSPPPSSPGVTTTSLPDKLFYEGIGGAAVQSASGGGELEQARFTLEIDLSDSREQAEQLIQKLRAQGVEAYFTPLSRSGHVIYRVRHGIFTDKAAAGQVQTALKTQQKIGTKIVRLQ